MRVVGFLVGRRGGLRLESNNVPQNLVRADNDGLLRAVIGVLDLQNDVDPCPAVRARLHAQQKDARALLFRLRDEPVLRLRLAQVFPVDKVVPGDALQRCSTAAQVKLAAVAKK